MMNTSALGALLDGWKARGWAEDDLHLFRMEAGDGDDGDSGDGDAGDADGDAGGDAGDGSGDAGSGDQGGKEPDWKAEARKWETRAKENKTAAEELDKLRKASQSEQEKAIEAAKDEGRKSATAEVGQKLAAAEIKAALTGVVKNPAGIVEDLNLTKYVTADGDVDEDAVKALKAKYEAELKPGKPGGSADGGGRGDDKPTKSASLEDAITKKLSA